ncbi:MAG: DUF4197 domain-containing protein [Bacteroidetes bacterium]|nr:DUF4197 domain-containing protein [Bacteroidota bacterium]
MITIKKISLLVFILPLTCCSQIDFKKITKEVDKTINGDKPLTNDEIIRGLKEALNVGSNNAAGSASKLDGYFKNSLIKIPFPPEAREMESKLRSLGMGKQVDDFILTVNRAAEEAAKQSSSVFVNAITGMTINDGISILRGSDTAATGYLRRTTGVQLHDKFKPVIKSATQKVEVTKYWNPLATTYNALPFVKKVNTDLEEYITQRALNGLFTLVSQEEIKIRKDPVARVTDILKKVFGSK